MKKRNRLSPLAITAKVKAKQTFLVNTNSEREQTLRTAKILDIGYTTKKQDEQFICFPTPTA